MHRMLLVLVIVDTYIAVGFREITGLLLTSNMNGITTLYYYEFVVKSQ